MNNLGWLKKFNLKSNLTFNIYTSNKPQPLQENVRRPQIDQQKPGYWIREDSTNERYHITLKDLLLPNTISERMKNHIHVRLLQG